MSRLTALKEIMKLLSLRTKLVLMSMVILNRGTLISSNSNGDDQSISASHWCEPRNSTCICGEKLKIIAVPQCKTNSNNGRTNCTDCPYLSVAKRCSSNKKFCDSDIKHICRLNGYCRCFPSFTCQFTQSEKSFRSKTRRNITERQAGTDCPKPTDPLNGKAEFEFDVFKPGDAVKYRCDEGYTMLGSSTRHCQENGRWRGEKPTCEKLCSFPTISNQDGLSYVENPGRQNNLLTTSGNIVLNEIEFTCKPGYTLEGPMRIRCMGGGIWDHNPPSCVKADGTTCPALESIVNGHQIPDSLPVYESGSIVNFKCDNGFRLVGQSLLICTNSGTWSSNVPKCQGGTIVPTTTKATVTESTPSISPSVTGFCLGPQEIKFGTFKIKITGDFRDKRPENMFEVGASVEFKCQHAYELHGQSEQFCLATGQWSGRMPECKPECGKGVEPKTPHVVGGTAAVQNGYPWQVALTMYLSKPEIRTIHCGGAVLSDRWVLTAAHCLTEPQTTKPWNPSTFLLFFGKHFTNRNVDDNNVISGKVAQFVIHPSYDPLTFDHDIALVMLTAPLIFNSVVLPICLPFPNSPTALQEGKKGVVTGWGYTDTNRTKPPTELMMLETPIVNNKKCEDNYRSVKAIVTDNMFCAGVDEGGKNTCEGDSGGPMVFYDEDHSRYYVEGLVSWGPMNCVDPGFFGVFVRVRNFVPWISSYVGN